MVKRSVLVGTRWDLALIDDVDKLVKTHDNQTGVFKNVSEAIRECTKVGIKVHNYQKMMKDPKLAEEFRKKMQDYIQNEEVIEWVHTLDNSQIDGFILTMQMEKDKRWELKSLV